MEKIHKLNVLTCRSQVRNPAGLRRFPSPHSSLFFSGFLVEFSGSNEEGRGVGPYIGEVTPVARGGGVGGATGPPVARWGGDRPPFFSRDLVANLKKKSYA